MHNIEPDRTALYIDGEARTQESAAICAASAAALYGKGVFTTIRVRDRRPLLWDKHWRRIGSNAAALGISLAGMDGEKIFEDIARLIGQENIKDGRVRLTFYDDSPTEMWPYEGGSATRVLIMAQQPRARPAEAALTVSPFPILSASPLAAVKSCNYLERLMAIKEARQKGFDEAVRSNENGAAATAVMANLFWLAGGKLFTPSLSAGCLPGTTREFVSENLDCIEIESDIDALRHADAVFLTSAGLGIVEVTRFEGRRFLPSNHPITQLAKEL